jgi:hypothetical protein
MRIVLAGGGGFIGFCMAQGVYRVVVRFRGGVPGAARVVPLAVLR